MASVMAKSGDGGISKRRKRGIIGNSGKDINGGHREEDKQTGSLCSRHNLAAKKSGVSAAGAFEQLHSTGAAMRALGLPLRHGPQTSPHRASDRCWLRWTFSRILPHAHICTCGYLPLHTLTAPHLRQPRAVQQLAMDGRAGRSGRLSIKRLSLNGGSVMASRQARKRHGAASRNGIAWHIATSRSASSRLVNQRENRQWQRAHFRASSAKSILRRAPSASG